MKPGICGIIIAAAVLCISAAVWEGVSAVVSSEELSGTYSIATNTFPRNTVVDITNLENGKMVRVIVATGLDNAGLLAMLSRNTADAIDLRHDSTCRIRITQPPDAIAFSRFRLGPIASPMHHPVAEAGVPLPEDTLKDTIAESEGLAGVIEPVGFDEPARLDDSAGIDEAATLSDSMHDDSALAGFAALAEPENQSSDDTAYDTQGHIIKLTWTAIPDTAEPTEPAELLPTEPVDAETVIGQSEQSSSPAHGHFVLIPADERPPESPESYAIAELPVILAIPVDPPAAAVSGTDSPFQAPMVNHLEQGKWYVQIAAYNRPDHVEDELSRIGTTYPLAIQNIGTEINPIFRILLGPLNQGESGAMLKRFKSIGYTDAFMRQY
ncbi:MAG: hypothetical protein FWD36_10045 [Treponema sp.]|nr:hypothetical protein [Treponema sp.]